MKRSHCRWVLLFLLTNVGVVSAAAPIPAGKANAIPTELPVLSRSMFVLQINGFEKTKEKINAYLKTVIPKQSESINQQLDELIHSGLNGRELKGITKEGRLYFAIHNFTKFTQGISIAIPCDDTRAFLNGFFPKDKVKNREKKADFEIFESEGQTIYAVERPSYLVLTMSEELANEYAKKFEGLKSKSMGETAEAFFQSDVSIYFNIDEINQVHSEQVQQVKMIIFQIIGLVESQVKDEDFRRPFELLRYINTGLFQLIADGQTFALGLEIRPEGVSLRGKGIFNPNSATGKLLTLESPIKHDALNDLPSGSTIYTSSSIGPGIAKFFNKIYSVHEPNESNDLAIQSVADWMTIQNKSTSLVTVDDYDKMNVMIAKHPESQKTVDAYAAAMNTMGEGDTYQRYILKGKPTVAEKAETHRGFTFHRTTFTMDYEKSYKTSPAEERKKLIEELKRSNPETKTIWMGAKEGQIVQVAATDWKSAKAMIDTVFDSQQKLGSVAPAKSIFAMLPAECSQIILFDFGKWWDQSDDLNPEISKLGLPKLPKHKPTKIGSLFIGVAVVMKGNSASLDLFVPTLAVTNLADFFATQSETKEEKK